MEDLQEEPEQDPIQQCLVQVLAPVVKTEFHARSFVETPNMKGYLGRRNGSFQMCVGRVKKIDERGDCDDEEKKKKQHIFHDHEDLWN